MKKQLLLLSLMFLAAISTFAEEVEIGGLWYDLISETKEAKVIQYKNWNYYKGDIVIPQTVRYEGDAYSVTSIEDGAFRECNNLTSVVIPVGVVSIGKHAFSNCRGLISATMSNSVTSIGDYAFTCCEVLSSVTIPNSVTYIGSEAFSSCHGLASVTIPNNVKNIGIAAFSRCKGLSKITIGSGVEIIYHWAFSYCQKLVHVYCYAKNVPSMSTDYGDSWTNIFENSNIESATLHVPESSVSVYKQAEPWKSFKSIVPLDDIPEQPQCATPTIELVNGKLKLSCETEGVRYKTSYSIEGSSGDSEDDEVVIATTATCHISVYATKEGYINSEAATKDITVNIGVGEKGDVNGDGVVDVADVVAVVNIILHGEAQSSPEVQAHAREYLKAHGFIVP